MFLGMICIKAVTVKADTADIAIMLAPELVNQAIKKTGFSVSATPIV